jgi:hypothetical protein
LSPGEKCESKKGMVEILSFSSVKARFPHHLAAPVLHGSRAALNPLI